MTKKEFIDLLIEELTIENTAITENTELSSIEEWDSMGRMLCIGMISEHFDQTITSDELKNLTTVQSLIDKLGDKSIC